MQDDIKKSVDSIPGASDIPVIGNAFKGRASFNKKTELVIFLRPTVMSSASLESDELATYKQYLPLQQLKQLTNSNDGM
jgi:general secretion pathway protein D